MWNLEQIDAQQNVGTVIDVSNVMYPEISDHIRTHPDRQQISELADVEFAWIAPVDEARRKLLELPESTTAVIEWDNVADEDPTTEIRALNAAEQLTIVSQATSTLIEHVLTHYDADPAEDGHPAFRLYAEWQRRKMRATEKARSDNAHWAAYADR